MILANAGAFRVPRTKIVETEEALRAAGADGYEVFVLWSGRLDGGSFEVRTLHVPQQSSYRLDTGLLVRVEGDALHRLNTWLYEHDELLGVQVHAHPTDAYHSDTDNTYPIVTTIGALSIVAADFAAHGLLNEATAAYRLTKTGWDDLGAVGLDRVLEVVP